MAFSLSALGNARGSSKLSIHDLESPNLEKSRSAETVYRRDHVTCCRRDFSRTELVVMRPGASGVQCRE
jgi:hypothetical protein